MAKVRKGRLLGVVVAFGAVAWGVAALSTGNGSRKPAEALQAGSEEQANEPATNPVQVTYVRRRSRSEVATAGWAKHISQLAPVFEKAPGLTVHSLEWSSDDSLRLSCTVGTSNLRSIAYVRDVIESNFDGSTVSGSEVHIHGHTLCDLHGDVSKVMEFDLVITPAGQAPADSVQPGTLRLVPRCRATH